MASLRRSAYSKAPSIARQSHHFQILEDLQEMTFEVELVSKEIVKPSSPTPHHLRHYQLSFLDQISPLVNNSLLLFYPTDGDVKFNTVEKFDLLKQSLSEVLTSFYPLAGRMKDNLFIDCTDEGVPYVQTQVNCQLSHVLENSVPSELNMLLPLALDDTKEFLLGVQFNVFRCSGIVIGLVISHKVGDASSFFTFLRAWAATARGEADVVHTEFISATLFPPLEVSKFGSTNGITKDDIVAKRFVFRSSSIEAIRAKYGKNTSLENRPTRVEALSAFIWSRIMAATGAKTGPDRNYCMIHAANLRKRMDPPLPENSFGNYYGIALTIPSTDREDGDSLVSQIRDSISKIDKEYMKKLQDGNEHLNFIKQFTQSILDGQMEHISFTSLCRFPLYDADFGWTKPVWVASPCHVFKNMIVFMDTASGDGVEALIHLKEEDMAKLEEDEELLLFVTPSK